MSEDTQPPETRAAERPESPDGLDIGPQPADGPAGRRTGSWARALLVAAAAFLVAVALVFVLPLGDDQASRPDVQRMLVAAILIAAVTTAALFAIIRLELRLPTSVAVLCVVFNALVVGVKFVAGPNAVYVANAKKTFEADISLNDPGGAVLTAAFVFVLYAATLYVIYRLARARTGLQLPGADDGRPGRSAVAVVLAVVVVLVGLAATGIGLILALIGLSAGFSYIGYVFGSAGALLVALTLAVAAAAAQAAFRRAGDVAVAAQDVGVLVSLFWVCLAFLAVYHVLWVVYILLITSLWPLKVVTPK